MITLKVGNSVLDGDHGALARRLDCIVDLARGDAGRAALLAEFQGLVDYLDGHFSLEEVVLNGLGYAGLDDHADRHADLLALFRQQVQDFTADPQLPAFQVLLRFQNALYEHELVEDSDYWDLLRESGRAPTVVWDDRHATGHEVVDRHHKAIGIHIDHLEQCALTGEPGGFLDSLREFRDLAAYHFRTEEELMDSACSAQVAAAHHGAHERLLKALDDATARVQRGEMAPLDLVRDFLTYWAADHIAHADLIHLGPQPE